jgi:hypothetical protein
LLCSFSPHRACGLSVGIAGLGKVIAAEQTRKAFDYVRPYLQSEHVGAHAFTESVNDASKTLLQSLGFEVLTSLYSRPS